jgi:hypothetical protein
VFPAPQWSPTIGHTTGSTSRPDVRPEKLPLSVTSTDALAAAQRMSTTAGRSLAQPRNQLRAALILIAAQLAFRAWVVYGAWFYFDDFVFIGKAYRLPLSWSFLMTDYGGHRMPAGFALTWLVTRLAPMSWPLAATLILAAQAVASYGCWRMLRILFGDRRLNLVWLAIYLFSPVTVSAFVWWAAAINQLPFQIAFFFGVAAHVTYLRTRRFRHAMAAAAWLLLGLAFYEKTVLLIPVYAFLALGYFASGSIVARVRSTVARYWPGVALYVGLGAAYAGLYVATAGPAAAGSASDVPYFDVGVNMIGRALLPGLLGGPWAWQPLGPDALAAPPGWAWGAVVAIVAVTIAGSLTNRVRAGRAWMFWASYLAAMVALVALNRAGAVGPQIGLVYRYVTDGAMITILVLGLVFTRIPGATESSAPAATTRRAPDRSVAREAAVCVGALAVVVGSFFSSAQYVHRWHSDNAAKAYIQHARSDVDRYGGDVAIADGEVPETLMWKTSTPWNLASNLLAPAGVQLKRQVTDRLMVLDTAGHLRPATVAAQMRGTRPDPGCGIVGSVRIGLTGDVFDPDGWWLRIGYIATGDTSVTVHAGGVTVKTQLLKGLHAIFVPGHGRPSSVHLTGMDSSVRLCIGDDVQVGPGIVALG